MDCAYGTATEDLHMDNFGSTSLPLLLLSVWTLRLPWTTGFLHLILSAPLTQARNLHLAP